MNESAGLWVRRYPGRPPPLVALHGFTQTGAMFAELAEILGGEVLAPDLPGHGRSADYPASFSSAVAGVGEVLAALAEPALLIGYSQGGRVALAVALERPELVSHLVLVSTAPGIAGEFERSERRRVDEERAAVLRNEGLEAFLETWLSSPILSGLAGRGSAWQAADRAVRLENTAGGLAGALIGMGQGTQPYLGECLPELTTPALVIAGELDQKYAALAAAMYDSLPYATLHIIPDTGHAVIGEQPRALADLIASLLAG